MKNLYLFTLSLFVSVISFSQVFYSDFEDGTLQGWTNKDTATVLLTVEGNFPYQFLQKECDATNSATGEMTIINTNEWAGNYFYNAIGDEYMINIDDIIIKNENNFDIHLRYGFMGANGYMVVTTDPIIIPAFSDWDVYNQYFYISFPTISNLTILNDINGLPYEEVFDNVHELFEDVVEFRIFHNESISFDGQIVSGTLQIEDIFSFIFLSNKDQSIADTKIYPNPAKNSITLKLPHPDNGDIVLYNVLGEIVMTEKFSSMTTQIDLSELNSGIYIVSIKTEDDFITKKIIKL